MDSRRLMIFLRTVDGVDNASPNKRKNESTEPSAIKRKLYSEEGTIGIKRKIFTLLDKDPGKFYWCIHIVDPEGERLLGKFVYSLEDPNPNLLNVVFVFRLGLPLSKIAVSYSPRLGLAEVKTISAEALSSISALGDAGLHLPSINVEDITISASNAIHRAYLKEAMTNEKATAFGVMLDDLVSRVLDSSTDKFLRDSLPTPSLIPFVLNAQIIVFLVEYVTEAVITNLGTT
ncbi:hypothetical protein J3E71DRAFT_362224 [Bipolaris maydis]|nr:hypothetical protein J3E71DRAFT_362224 [Bipolaris maydis]